MSKLLCSASEEFALDPTAAVSLFDFSEILLLLFATTKEEEPCTLEVDFALVSSGRRRYLLNSLVCVYESKDVVLVILSETCII